MSETPPTDGSENLGSSSTAHGSVLTVGDLDYSALVDMTLCMVYSQAHRLGTELSPTMWQPQTLEQLRVGPLGQKLQSLAAVARGEALEPPNDTLKAIESVLQILFYPIVATGYMIPRAFWETDLGRMLAVAKARALDAHTLATNRELVSIRQAAEMLGVDRSTIYRWMDEPRGSDGSHLFDYVRDELRGRTFLLRREVEDVRRRLQERDDPEDQLLEQSDAEGVSPQPH